MGDIETFAYDYCEARISRLSRLSFPFTENRLQTCQTVHKCGKNCHDKRRLSWYWMIIAPYDYC